MLPENDFDSSSEDEKVKVETEEVSLDKVAHVTYLLQQYCRENSVSLLNVREGKRVGLEHFLKK